MPTTADARTRPKRVRSIVRDRLTVEQAIDRLGEVAQSVVADQIEVARLDVKRAGGRLLRSAALSIAGALLLGASFTALTLAAYVLLGAQLSPAQRLGLIALAQALLGSALLVAGARVMKSHDDD